MKPVYDAIGQEIKVGSFVALANGNYVKQEFGFVYKLGNADNAAVARNKHGGSYVAAEGLLVIDSILQQTLDRKIKDKYATMHDEVKEIFTHERPKSGRSVNYLLIIDFDTDTLFIRSFRNVTEARKVYGQYEDRNNIHRFRVLNKHHHTQYSFRSALFLSSKTMYGFTFKQINELGFDGYIDDDNGVPVDSAFIGLIRK